MKNCFLATVLITAGYLSNAQGLLNEYMDRTTFTLSIKIPGNPASSHILSAEDGRLTAVENLPVNITQTLKGEEPYVDITLRIQAQEDCFINLSGEFITNQSYDTTQLYLPGFWYRKNLRSPSGAPSARVSTDWIVREDRLSTPLTGAYDQQTKQGYSLIRMDDPTQYALTAINEGEVILSGKSELGAVGFGREEGKVKLTFSFPYKEAPNTYYRKLTLGPPVTTFLALKKGGVAQISYRLMKYEAADYAGYIQKTWMQSYQLKAPKPIGDQQFSNEEIKGILANFYRESFIDAGELKGFSGVHLRTAVCEKIPLLEVGFVGRVLLNAFNALEFGYEQKEKELISLAQQVWESYGENGFTKEGFIREVIDYRKNDETDIYSIRRQSEGLYAALLYLNYERKQGRTHTAWETRVKTILAGFAKLQLTDGSFPRKFRENLSVVDPTGGSSPTAVLPLVMAYKYFGDKAYLDMAREVARYQEAEIISKSDYFSSTLDADCEDKEASLYATTALYYLALVTKGKEREAYIALAEKAAYFAMSWYYTWDVPFAQGQMLGDLGLKTRGWGNVSVENNHIDVYIFEFDEILDWLTVETGEKHFSAFAEVIRSSMREQLLPYEGHMVGIAKEGYYPEVVQHTQWDYGRFGKGFYNDIFAPGWVITSLWELLTEKRTENFLTGE